MDFITKSEVADSLDRIEKLIQCGIFNQNNAQHALMRAAFTEVMIHLSDLMSKAARYTERIDFKKDVIEGDVTDLITNVRNALCHVSSGEHMLGSENSIKFSFNIAFGKCNVMKMGDVEIKSKYEDDICFFFGEKGIYLKRHIIRAAQMAQESFVDKKFIQNTSGRWVPSFENTQQPVA